MVIIIPATEPAACKAALVTFAGSNIPISIMSPYSPFAALKPNEPSLSITFAIITDDSSPAFSAICLRGVSNALRTILMPTF